MRARVEKVDVLGWNKSSIPSEMFLSYPLLVPAVTCAGMVETEAWERITAGAGVAVMAVGVTLTVVRDEGTHGRFLLKDGRVL